ncbi:hypothetical protein HYPSUDRAFT_206137 [Hypholoma sublateritium FD-334 SS-4]|uniref:AB hydrolase-1 domain-containing protein n=1 Tax=Hypholoma sublateritium (strain FD-334 SS-4) TaxID=945553 RepID=A0A0D2NES4_HYPSF|nr:hypothetical protein HYPSUDRAFT_206137 [Hypholoma sublateritium FD-334 SS-4]
MYGPLSGKPHYQLPSGPRKGYRTVNPRRRLAPLLQPPKLVPLPHPLPDSINRKCAFTSTHTLSVHLFPAAFPRAWCPDDSVVIPAMGDFPGKDGKENRKKWMLQTAERMVWEKKEAEKMFPAPAAGLRVAQEGIWSAVSRIRRNKRKIHGKGITIVTLHPIGFHKEIWEPALKNLIEFTEASGVVHIDEIWAIDAVNHGDSALINGSHIPKLPDRSDYGRDLANLLIHHLPNGSDAFGRDLPTILARLPESVGPVRVRKGFSDRHIIAMGHSLGGDGSVVCGISYPRLFSAIIPVETTLFPPTADRGDRRQAMILSALSRRSSWPSREEARKALLKAPLFQAFDPSVFDAYITYGMYEDPSTGFVHLKCPPACEGSEYTENRTMSEGWELLPTLDERVELRWILGGRDDASSLVGGRHISQGVAWRRPKNASNVMIPGAGHLCVQEKPTEFAEDVALFLAHKFSGTRTDHFPAKL